MKGTSDDSKRRPGGRRRWLFWGVLAFVAAGILGGVLWRRAMMPINDSQTLIVVGQREVPIGGPLGLRIVVLNRHTGQPIPGAWVRITLTPLRAVPVHAKSYSFRQIRDFTSRISWDDLRTDAEGTITNELRVSSAPPGPCELVIQARSIYGQDRITRSVRLVRLERLLLSCDKPLYQPGQTVHLRLLASAGWDRHPRTNAPVTFEIVDAKTNLVFRARRVTSRFGIAAADFVLARELNWGHYRITARLGAPGAGTNATTVAERAFEVRRHVLPKFKLALSLERRGRRPGEPVRGTVTARYFFGRPVSGAKIQLSAQTSEAAPQEVAQTTGRTDAAGRWSFALSLPETLPLAARRRPLNLTARVTDSAGQEETIATLVAVRTNALELRAFPEMGRLVPGLENRVYVVASQPDGRPVACRIRVGQQDWRPAPNGWAVLNDRAEAGQKLSLEAETTAGKRATAVLEPPPDDGLPVILRPERAVYDSGAIVRGTAFCGEVTGPLFLDLIQGTRILRTRKLRRAGDTAAFSVALSPGVSGVVELRAYTLERDGQERSSSRLVAVRPASALRIQATLDAGDHRPGGTARWRIAVTDAQGRPAPAALGVSVVDEALLARHEDHWDLPARLAAGSWTRWEAEAPDDFPISSASVWSGAAGETAAAAWLARLGFLQRQARKARWQRFWRELGVSPEWIERNLRSRRGTRCYEWCRSDSRYGPVLAAFEGRGGAHSLVGGTYWEKQRRDQRHRREMKIKLAVMAVSGLLSGAVLTTLFLVVLGRSTGMRKDLTGFSSAEKGNHYKLAVAHQVHRTLALLILWSLLGYPAGLIWGALFFAGLPSKLALVLMLAGEIALTLWALGRLRARARRVWRDYGDPFPHGLFLTLKVYRAIFLAIRGLAVMLALAPGVEQWMWLVLVLGAVLAPFWVLLDSRHRIQAFLAAHRIPDTRDNSPDPIILLGMGVLALLLIGMLLPALAKAKAKAGRVTLQNSLKQLQLAAGLEAEADRATAPRVRRDFPETLFWQPELITDDQGRVTLEIPLADSITTWRARFNAVNAQGRLGATNQPLRVFQPFFVDLNPPTDMTAGDEISMPVVCYNYLDTPQTLRLQVADGDWFESPRGGREFTVTLDPGAVKSVPLPLKLIRAGEHRLRVTARAAGASPKGAPVADAVERVLRVRPAGWPVTWVKNLVLRDRVEAVFDLPPDQPDETATLRLKLYPSRFSEVLDGIEGLFRRPHGCFEQTSSVTYPNVLALAYLKRVGRLTPPLAQRARQLVSEGYQRLLTFEVPGGGFSWFGQPPAGVGLTAYGVLEFTDMARVRPVDSAVIQRSVAWLAARQEPGGAWRVEKSRGAGERNTRFTAYIAWALAEAGVSTPALPRALDYLRRHVADLRDPYACALAANALLAANRTDVVGRQLLARLIATARSTPNGEKFWATGNAGVFYSREFSVTVETTALAVMALEKTGEAPGLAHQGLAWLSARRRADGGWGATQATILALRTLLLGTEDTPLNTGADVFVRVNGAPAGTIHLTPGDAGLLRVRDLTPHLRPGRNRIELTPSPAHPISVQLVGVYWRTEPEPSAPESAAAADDGLVIEQHYDRHVLAVGEWLRCRVTVRLRGTGSVPMVLVDLGIPPGFALDTDDLDALVAEGRIARWESRRGRACLYLHDLDAAHPLKFTCRLQALMPLRVTAPATEVYEYYTPAHRARVEGPRLEVTP